MARAPQFVADLTGGGCTAHGRLGGQCGHLLHPQSFGLLSALVLPGGQFGTALLGQPTAGGGEGPRLPPGGFIVFHRAFDSAGGVRVIEIERHTVGPE